MIRGPVGQASSLSVFVTGGTAEKRQAGSLSYPETEAPLVAGFAKAGIFGPSLFRFTVRLNLNLSPFEIYKAW